MFLNKVINKPHNIEQEIYRTASVLGSFKSFERAGTPNSKRKPSLLLNWTGVQKTRRTASGVDEFCLGDGLRPEGLQFLN